MYLAIFSHESRGHRGLLRAITISFNLPVLDAIACAHPVVAASKSLLPEVGGSAALHATSQSGEAYATALHALDSPAVRGESIRTGLSRIEQFSWSQTMLQTVAVYLR